MQHYSGMNHNMESKIPYKWLPLINLFMVHGLQLISVLIIIRLESIMPKLKNL